MKTFSTTLIFLPLLTEDHRAVQRRVYHLDAQRREDYQADQRVEDHQAVQRRVDHLDAQRREDHQAVQGVQST